VHDCVKRVAREAGLLFDAVQKHRRIGREVEQVVQPLGAVAHAEDRPDLAEAPRRQPVAGGQEQLFALEARV
jgi:hypothetical protein